MKNFLFGTRSKVSLCIVLILMVSFILTGCSKNPNQDVEKGRTYAMIRLPDGSLVGGPVTNTAYGEGWAVINIDGVSYRTSPVNVVITREVG